MAIVMFGETLESHQHSMRRIPESRSHTYGAASPEQLALIRLMKTFRRVP